MPLMSMEEKVEIIKRSLAAPTYEEEMAILMALPLDPKMAQVARKVMGTEELRNAGFDLSEANAEYGDGWLDN